jgi:hypothetical protein
VLDYRLRTSALVLPVHPLHIMNFEVPGNGCANCRKEVLFAELSGRNSDDLKSISSSSLLNMDIESKREKIRRGPGVAPLDRAVVFARQRSVDCRRQLEPKQGHDGVLIGSSLDGD